MTNQDYLSSKRAAAQAIAMGGDFHLNNEGVA